RHNSDAVPAIVSPPIQIETAGVFQGLTTRDEGAQITDLRVTRYRADPSISERLEQARQRIALTLRIRIDENNDAVASSSQTALQSTRFPMIVLSQQAHTRLTPCDTLNLRSSPVTRTVVHHDHFDFAFVICD